MEPARPRPGQVVTVLRNRVRTEAQAAYVVELAEVVERATIVTFADPASHGVWRDHPRHHEAQRHGIKDYYSEYSIAVGETSYASAFIRSSPRSCPGRARRSAGAPTPR